MELYAYFGNFLLEDGALVVREDFVVYATVEIPLCDTIENVARFFEFLTFRHPFSY